MITLKKLTYLSLAFGLTILFIFVCILSQFGTRINSSETFQGFFDWYIALLLMNIFNMIITFIFLYFKSELVGQKGLKGKLGDKGEPGSSEKCFCKDESSNIGDAVGSEIDQINVTDDTHTHQITDGENTGTMIHRHENFTNYSGNFETFSNNRNIETFSNNRNFVSVAYGINTVSSTHYIYAVEKNGILHKLYGSNLDDLDIYNITSNSIMAAKNWSAITCSANGQKVYATVSGGSIWASPDSGSTWTEITTALTGSSESMRTPRNWSAITCNSIDGFTVYATVMGGKIYKGTNSGANWAPITEYETVNMATDRNWSAITFSADGNIIYATEQGGRIYKGTSSGTNWTEINTNNAGEPDMSTARNWSAITCSNEGLKVYATVIGGKTYNGVFSSNSWNWTEINQINNWSAITTNGNGNEVYATVKGENVYKYVERSGWSHVNSPKLNGKNFTSIDIITNNQFVAVSSEGIYVYDATDAANPTVKEYLTNTHSHQVHDVLT